MTELTERDEMTNRRAKLARLLGKHYGTSAGGDDYLWAMADVVLDLLHPTVTTAEELDALPVGSVVLCENRAFRRKTRTVEYQALDWEAPEFPFGCTSEWIWVHRPATVLHIG